MTTLLAVFLINMTSYDFSNTWVTEHVSPKHWKLVVKEIVRKGTGIEIQVNPNWKSYDLRVQYSRKNYEIWEDFDRLTKRITITILPDRRWQAHYEQ